MGGWEGGGGGRGGRRREGRAGEKGEREINQFTFLMTVFCTYSHKIRCGDNYI